MDIFDTLKHLDKNTGKYIMFFDKIDLLSLSDGSRFFEAKEKYVKSTSVGNVISKHKIEFWYKILHTNTFDSLKDLLYKNLGKNLIDSEIRKTINTITDIELLRVVKGLEETLNRKDLFNHNGEMTFDNHSNLFNDVMLKNSNEYKSIKPFIPISFSHVATNIGIYGYSIRDDVKPATNIDVFNITAQLMNKLFNNAVDKGIQQPPEFVSFSSSGGTGCVCLDEKLWDAKKYNFIYDSVRKVKMYEEMSTFSRDKMIDIMNASFKTVGSRWQMYPEPKKHERFSLTPFSREDKKGLFRSGLEYSLKESIQINSHNGFNHRTVDGVGSPSQYHGSHGLATWAMGLDGKLKSWVKFTPDSLIADINEIYETTGKIPVAYDVTNSESRLDSQAIVEVFFKSFFGGKFKDVAESVYYNTHNVGIYGAENGTLNYYAQRCGNPERFISGWIFTGLGNSWFYLIVQLIHEVIYRAIKQGLVSKHKPWSISPEIFLKVLDAELDSIKLFNQGDDMLIFVLPEDKGIYDNIVETNPFCKIVKEDSASMSGMLIEENSIYKKGENGKFVLHTKEATVLLKSSEKFEGRNWKHPLRSSITAGLCGKFELIKQRPVMERDDGGTHAISLYAKSLGLNIISHECAIILNLVDMLYDHKYDNSKYSKSITINNLMEKYELTSSHEIYWNLSSDEIAKSEIEGIDDLFILLPYHIGMTSPFFR